MAIVSELSLQLLSPTLEVRGWDRKFQPSNHMVVFFWQ